MIAEHGGTVVKTIGDVVMASFVEERDAVRAGAAMHRAFLAFRAEHPEARELFLRVGVHAGLLLRGDRERYPRLLRPDGERCGVAFREQRKPESSCCRVRRRRARSAKGGYPSAGRGVASTRCSREWSGKRSSMRSRSTRLEPAINESTPTRSGTLGVP